MKKEDLEEFLGILAGHRLETTVFGSVTENSLFSSEIKKSWDECRLMSAMKRKMRKRGRKEGEGWTAER